MGNISVTLVSINCPNRRPGSLQPQGTQEGLTAAPGASFETSSQESWELISNPSQQWQRQALSRPKQKWFRAHIKIRIRSRIKFLFKQLVHITKANKRAHIKDPLAGRNWALLGHLLQIHYKL